MWRIFTLCVLTFATMAGCDNSPEQEVIARFELGEKAIGDQDVAAYRAMLSAESIKMYNETIRLALESDGEQAKKLPPSTLRMILALRNRVPEEDLRRVAMEDVVQWQLDQEMLFVAADYGVLVHSAKINGDKAVIQFGVEQERGTSGIRMGGRGRRGLSALGSALGGGRRRTKIVPVKGLTQSMVRQGGVWLLDEVTSAAGTDTEFIQEANEARQSYPEYLMALEKEEFGSLREDVWRAPGK